MKAVVTAQEMAGMDSCAINELNIPGIILMENAGRGIADIAINMLGDPANKLVHIYCGSGNNGGDGYVVARHLLNHGVIVRTFILTTPDKIKGDALVNLNILGSMGHRAEFLTELPRLNDPALVLDAMLGTGVKGALRGLYVDAVNMINAQNTPVLAVDIPTGVNADTGQVAGPAIHASTTATMALPKRGLLFSPGREFAGTLEIVDISMPASVIEKKHPHVYVVDKEYVQSILPVRSPDAHKNKVGMIQVIAGSRGLTGAAALASTATLRSGAGLCYLAVPSSLNSILEAQCMEVITQPMEDNGGHFIAANFDAIQKSLRHKSAVVLGPGMGQAEETVKLVQQLLASIELPLVLDADGLNACAEHVELLPRYKGELVITPHPGELARLTGLSTASIVDDRIETARHYAQKWKCTLVLKGGPTVTALKNGHVYINSTGNAGMATAGSGDVLSGCIAGLIGQGMAVEEAAVAAVFVHGAAGDLAAARCGQPGMMAGDILDMIPTALQQ